MSKPADERSRVRSSGSLGNLLASFEYTAWPSSSTCAQVYALWNCSRFVSRLFKLNCRPLYQELESAAFSSIDPKLGFVRGAPRGKNLLPSERICGIRGLPSRVRSRLKPRVPA